MSDAHILKYNSCTVSQPRCKELYCDAKRAPLSPFHLCHPESSGSLWIIDLVLNVISICTPLHIARARIAQLVKRLGQVMKNFLRAEYLILHIAQDRTSKPEGQIISLLM